MYPIGSSHPLCAVHRSIFVYWTFKLIWLLQSIFRWLAGPDKFGIRRQVDVEHVRQRSYVHGVLSQIIAVAIMRVAEQYEQVRRRRSQVFFEEELLSCSSHTTRFPL